MNVWSLWKSAKFLGERNYCWMVDNDQVPGWNRVGFLLHCPIQSSVRNSIIFAKRQTNIYGILNHDQYIPTFQLNRVQPCHLFMEHVTANLFAMRASAIRMHSLIPYASWSNWIDIIHIRWIVCWYTKHTQRAHAFIQVTATLERANYCALAKTYRPNECNVCLADGTISWWLIIG